MGRVRMICDRGILSVVERARFHRGIADAAVIHTQRLRLLKYSYRELA